MAARDAVGANERFIWHGTDHMTCNLIAESGFNR